MRKHVVTFLVAALSISGLLLSAGVSSKVAAVNVFGNACTGTDSVSSACTDATSQSTSTDPVISDLRDAINIVSFIVGVASVIVIIISGFRMILSNGDSGAVGKARGSLIYALVGLLIAFIAQGIVVFVLDRIS